MPNYKNVRFNDFNKFLCNHIASQKYGIIETYLNLILCFTACDKGIARTKTTKSVGNSGLRNGQENTLPDISFWSS